MTSSFIDRMELPDVDKLMSQDPVHIPFRNFRTVEEDVVEEGERLSPVAAKDDAEAPELSMVVRLVFPDLAAEGPEYVLELGDAQVLVLGEEGHEFLVGVAEEIPDEAPQKFLGVAVLGDERMVALAFVN